MSCNKKNNYYQHYNKDSKYYSHNYKKQNYYLTKKYNT